MPRKAKARETVSSSGKVSPDTFASDLLADTPAERQSATWIVESNPGLPKDPRPRHVLCSCGAPRAPGKNWCEAHSTEYAKLWTLPPDPRFGPCREGD